MLLPPKQNAQNKTRKQSKHALNFTRRTNGLRQPLQTTNETQKKKQQARLNHNETRKFENTLKSYLNHSSKLPCSFSSFLQRSPLLPFFLLSRLSSSTPSPTLCSLSNLAAPISLIPGVVRRVIMIEKKNHPKKTFLGGGLQICPSSVEFTSVKNMNTRVKSKCE